MKDLLAHRTEWGRITKQHYSFTGSSDPATHVNAATASHYRSAAKLIRK